MVKYGSIDEYLWNAEFNITCGKCNKKRDQRDLLECNHCGEVFCLIEDSNDETCCDKHESES